MMPARALPALLLGLALAAACSRPEEPERAFPRDLAAGDTAMAGPAAPPPADSLAVPANGADSPAPAPAAPVPPAPSPGAGTPPTPAALSDSGWTVGTSSGSGSDRIATQRGVRVARQEDYDRIVLDLGADAVPGWRVEYVDRPVRQCGSGNEVRLEGDAWLSIRLEPAQAHDDAGRVTVENRALRPGLPNLLELRLICDFEGQVEWVAGLRSPEPYRVLRLREPGRVVVDIRHPRR